MFCSLNKAQGNGLAARRLFTAHSRLSVRLRGSFNSLSLSRKIRTSLATPYNRLTQFKSWFFVWQLCRAGSSSLRNLCHADGQQVHQISGDEVTPTLYLRQQARQDGNLKSQRASAAWEQESAPQHPAEGSALWSCTSALTQSPAFPTRLALKSASFLTSGRPRGAFHSAYTIAPYQPPPHRKNYMSSLVEMCRSALHKLSSQLYHCT